jgi:hypothetical protein
MEANQILIVAILMDIVLAVKKAKPAEQRQIALIA